MPRMDAKSLLLKVSRELSQHSAGYSPTLILPVRDHDSSRLPVTRKKISSALQVLQDFKNHLRQAEEMVAKLGFHMRELQILKTIPRRALVLNGAKEPRQQPTSQESTGKLLSLVYPAVIAVSQRENEEAPDKI